MIGIYNPRVAANDIQITARVRPFFGSSETEVRTYHVVKAKSGWVIDRAISCPECLPEAGE